MKFVVTGGGQRSRAVWSQEWKHYEQAIALTVDWDTGSAERLIEYNSPEDAISEKDANIVFKAGSLIDGKLYMCTQTEVLIYDYPSLKLDRYISLPCFNDLHHVTKVDGNIAVVSTGLDMLVLIDENDNVVNAFNSLCKDPWHKFSESTDYRKVISTKPHESHPNYIFQIDNETWVSRFEQKDAICVTDNSKRINIGSERIHDGIVEGNSIYFTTVNGTICVVNKSTYEIENIYDLNETYSGSNPLGWCRGLHVEEGRFFIGFSALRSTKLRENLAWIKTGFKKSVEETRALPTRIVEYDFKTRSIVKELILSDVGLDAVFSILKCD